MTCFTYEMIDFQLNFQVERLLHGDYRETGLISKIVFRKFIRHLRSKITLNLLQTLKTLWTLPKKHIFNYESIL